MLKVGRRQLLPGAEDAHYSWQHSSGKSSTWASLLDLHPTVFILGCVSKQLLTNSSGKSSSCLLTPEAPLRSSLDPHKVLYFHFKTITVIFCSGWELLHSARGGGMRGNTGSNHFLSVWWRAHVINDQTTAEGTQSTLLKRKDLALPTCKVPIVLSFVHSYAPLVTICSIFCHFIDQSIMGT